MTAPVLCPIVATCIVAAGCAAGARPPSNPPSDRAKVATVAYLPGTVGNAINGYWLTMEGVRKWFAVVDSLKRAYERDSTFGLSLDFPLSSPLEPHVQEMNGSAQLRAALAAEGVTAKDFIALTYCVAGGKVLRRVLDSLKATPDEEMREIMAFLELHRATIDSLEAALSSRR